MRSPLKVIIFLFRRAPSGEYEYLILYRQTERFGGFWQAISGAAEGNENPIQAAQRETEEETGLTPDAPFVMLASMTTLPADADTTPDNLPWGPDILVMTEYAFAVQVGDEPIQLSHEHQEYRWCSFEQARELLKWDSNRNALWELNYRLEQNLYPPPPRSSWLSSL